MSFKASDQAGNTGSNQEVIEIGNYPGRLVQLIDLGLQQPPPYKGEVKAPINMLRTTYELGTEFCLDDEGNEDPTRPRWIGEEFPFYGLGADRAKSTQRYNGLDPECEFGGDWEPLVGKDCTITVIHNPSKKDPNKVYANIGAVSPAMKGMVTPELVNDPVIWSLDDPDMEQFEKFPKFIQDKIKANLNFKGSLLEARLAGQPDPDPQPAPDATAEGADVENPYG